MASQTCKFQNFEILYTKQKTQKHKKWKDGSMQVEQDRTGNTSKSRVKLFDEDGLLLLNSVLHVPPVMCGQDLEIEQYLVQVLEPIGGEEFEVAKQENLCQNTQVTMEQQHQSYKKRKRATTRDTPTNSALNHTEASLKSQVHFAGRTVEEIIRLLSG